MNTIKQIEVHKPVYSSPPNKLLRYEESDFDDGAGHQAIIRTAIYLNKHGQEKTMVAQVMWK
jgi:hypothetical protein